MSFLEISNKRLDQQLLTKPVHQSPAEAVAWMGVIQAQDYKMSKLAIGLRLKYSKKTLVDEAINQGTIIRTHILRPTWHFVAAKDIYWLLELTAPRLQKQLASRHRELKLTDADLNKGIDVLTKVLSNHNHLIRKEIYQSLEQAKLNVKDGRGYHLLFWAELNGVICSGANQNGKPTYALLEERVPQRYLLSEEEALAELARRYFRSHGPATLADFAWWSGLTINRAKRGLALIQADLMNQEIEGEVFWFSELIRSNTSRVYLLPAYDEFLIAYKNKSISMPYKVHRKKVHNVGIFRPFVILDGMISGTWKLSQKQQQWNVAITLFRKLKKEERQLIQEQLERLEQFWEISFGTVDLKIL